jgi:cellulose synthase/poly-beta-1,6-N-acetylglucosamine synthase-like glycosyltransferase
MNLAVIGGEPSGERLLQRLPEEPRWYIRLTIIHCLARIQFTPAVPVIIDILRNAPHWVRQKSIAVLPFFGEALNPHISGMIHDNGRRDRELIFQLALKYQSPAIHQFLLDCLRGSHGTLIRRSAQVLERTAPHILVEQELYTHPDMQVRSCAIRSMQSSPTAETIDVLIGLLAGEKEQTDAAITALQRILMTKPLLIDRVFEAFIASTGAEREKHLARALEIRLEYLLSLINTARYNEVRKLIEVLLSIRRTAVLFGYLDRLSDIKVEESILPILAGAMHRDDELRTLYSRYLPDRIAANLSIEKSVSVSHAEKAPLKKGDRRILMTAFLLIVLTGPLIYIGTRLDNLPALSFLEHIREYAYGYNFFFAFYSMAVNSIYLVLLVAALFYLMKQLQFWKIHSLRFLFSPELLPSISILAPAFNEEKNIVNNVKSLLNLHYPDFEVIIINDGSKDRTIDELIDHFFLERSDKAFQATIATEPVRGVYTSIHYPNLTVVDKSNGGKADSLNAGINLAAKDFICTIDSDSLLEHDALTKIAYQSLLIDREPVAMGGNILPANGCSVRNGRLVNIKLGRSHLVRFQTIEYMRSFLAGRLGWSFFNSMVIISGAFGLFLRRRVVEIGGYLTPKSRMHAGTVGEDMELVVQLHEHLGRKGVRYRVFDAFNANCWTEVPETFKIFHRQRDRLHRGLIESVLLHKKMPANPRFGAVGLLAFPYFFLFELIEPFLEFYGYVNLFISIGSLIISENEILYFNTRKTVLIVLYGVLENFGFRQVMSMIRVTVYVTFMFKEKSWGG